VLKGRVCELHLPLDANGAGDRKLRSGLERVLEQRSLPEEAHRAGLERADCYKNERGRATTPAARRPR
jgi:hypothetical protein